MYIVTGVKHLIGEPDFRDVQLQWEYDELSSFAHEIPKGFQIRYCELQAWGPHRCRTRVSFIYHSCQNYGHTFVTESTY